MPEICDGGPCESAADALRSAVRHVRRRAIEQHQELDDMTRAYQELRARFDQAEGGDGLDPWRRALDG